MCLCVCVFLTVVKYLSNEMKKCKTINFNVEMITFHRRGPTGGVAYGMPRKTSTARPLGTRTAFPRTTPYVVVTSGWRPDTASSTNVNSSIAYRNMANICGERAFRCSYTLLSSQNN